MTTHPPRHRSTHGCWTCKLRRKKCDETYPTCDACGVLDITCHYGREKPEWMDGGPKQEQMAEELKSEVKAKASQRRNERPLQLPRRPRPEIDGAGIERTSTQLIRRAADCESNETSSSKNVPFERSDTVLITFYLETLVPFLFPFYQPSPLQGGKSWILEMMISSPVVRHAMLCQASHFFSLAQVAFNRSRGSQADDKTFLQTRDAFEVLRQALQKLNNSSMPDHLHGAVRILSSIMQVQRFETALMNVENSLAHMDGAVALFKQIIGSGPTFNSPESFEALLNSLGPPTEISPAQGLTVPSAEQVAFRFSSTLLIFDDVIISTVLQKPPRLGEFHHGLLGDAESQPSINLEDIVGCQNWVLLQIGEIAILDAWKSSCKRDGHLDVVELGRRATIIQNSIDLQLTSLENQTLNNPQLSNSGLDRFWIEEYWEPQYANPHISLVTQLWAHAALLYLFVTASGWQPAHPDVQHHVRRVIYLLTHETMSPPSVRTMVWPFCVAGCLAQPHQEIDFRGIVQRLQPSSLFRTSHKALEIMEDVWRKRDEEDTRDRNFAECFKFQGEPILLI